MNTARAFGPAVVSGFINSHWVVSTCHMRVYLSSSDAVLVKVLGRASEW